MDNLVNKLKSLLLVGSVFLYSVGNYADGVSNLFNTLLDYIKYINSIL